MTPRRSHDQQDRLRALGLDASPAARRLRARIPRPPTEPVPGIPSAPYAVPESAVPYAWPERDPLDRVPAPPEPPGARTVRTPPPRGPAPWTGAADDTAEVGPHGTARLTPRPRGGHGAEDAARPTRTADARGVDGPAHTAEPSPDIRVTGADDRHGDASGEHGRARRTGPGRRGRPRVAPTPVGGARWPGDRDTEAGDARRATPAPRPCADHAPGPGNRPRRHADDPGGHRGRGSDRAPGTVEGEPLRGGGPDDAPRSDRAGGARGSEDAPVVEEAGPEGPVRAPRRRGEGADAAVSRPPVGYTEFLPERHGTFMERLSRGWLPEATMSRRAVAALLVVGLIAIAAVLFLRDRPSEAAAPETVAHVLPAEVGTETGVGPGTETDPATDLVVHVGGEVEDPGLYTLPPGSRVADAVEAAGGALPDADLDLLNLARSLIDGEQILVGLPRPEAAAPPAGTSEGPLVNINLADEKELETLPRVGEVTAAKIVAHREANGPFTSVDDLINVDRIGARTLEEIRPHATVG
ncbi:helix-hairpin-helix domain-containing protein [Nocardiopsis lambiniae]|uniref:Helix-hairpin-helix domain-containing protein n=1 Tax=Nocardiopsis lambiniae TaxID=3075539 RepID=A0ABU2M473_9ACTN|nr:helix-hairpin-helix domain-containing protein [Nocardiopsis sp. DSM 44743]MDT0327437.1 helix-hairpin-helix domain-containing protein [Nocardiopsis sp. DSM 44743]